MSDQHPSGAKAWAQMQLAKALFKVYQLKALWANRFGRKSTPDGIETHESTNPID